MNKTQRKKLRREMKQLIAQSEISKAEQIGINIKYQQLTGKLAPYTTCGNKLRARIVVIYQMCEN